MIVKKGGLEIKGENQERRLDSAWKENLKQYIQF